jgi:hypothetical protein
MGQYQLFSHQAIIASSSCQLREDYLRIRTHQVLCSSQSADFKLEHGPLNSCGPQQHEAMRNLDRPAVKFWSTVQLINLRWGQCHNVHRSMSWFLTIIGFLQPAVITINRCFRNRLMRMQGNRNLLLRVCFKTEKKSRWPIKHNWWDKILKSCCVRKKKVSICST